MRVYGLEKYIGKTISDVDIDRNFDEDTDFVTLTFEDGKQLQFWAGTQVSAEGETHAELQFSVDSEYSVVFS